MAISDLHVAYPENREIVQGLRPESEDDWLIVAGDVGEFFADIEWALRLLAERFAKVIWSPGNHELWTVRDDPVRARGVERYRMLVDMCRSIGVVTPEDPYVVYDGPGGPVTVAPLFTLYDYTFRPPDLSKEEAMAWAQETGIVCTDEFVLHPDPHPTRDAWCRARLRETEIRLDSRDPDLPTVLINHWPLTRHPTEVLRYPQFAQWCGSVETADWHVRYNAAAVVYGHLHIPRTTWHDGVRFEEVSLGYPRERRMYGFDGAKALRCVLPAADGGRA
ncbi:metallophosphoesterase [Sphaerisporangium rubeum]|nr:metallophosphoesterase [Sphaerisporangium rubeum]